MRIIVTGMQKLERLTWALVIIDMLLQEHPVFWDPPYTAPSLLLVIRFWDLQTLELQAI